MKDFHNDEAAAALLRNVIDETFDAVIAVLPNSAKIAVSIAKGLGVPILEYWDDVAFESHLPLSKVVVVDDGVETGTKALKVAEVLGGGIIKYLAVPVCSREIEAKLLSVYRKVYSLKKPFVRRSLDWHYEVRPEYSAAEARSILKSALH
jgi:predicted phosphoribosyltransferase